MAQDGSDDGEGAGSCTDPKPSPRLILLTCVVAVHARGHTVSSRPRNPPVEALHSLWELGKKRDWSAKRMGSSWRGWRMDGSRSCWNSAVPGS